MSTLSVINPPAPHAANKPVYKIVKPHLTTPHFLVSIEKPAIEKPGKQSMRELKKATRILRDLAKDVVIRNTSTPTPSTWLLRSLVHSHFCGLINNNWYQSICLMLEQTLWHSETGKRTDTTFLEPDGITPLFPNNEGFSLEDMRQFVQALLAHIQPFCSHAQSKPKPVNTN